MKMFSTFRAFLILVTIKRVNIFPNVPSTIAKPRTTRLDIATAGFDSRKLYLLYAKCLLDSDLCYQICCLKEWKRYWYRSCFHPSWETKNSTFTLLQLELNDFICPSELLNIIPEPFLCASDENERTDG